MMVCAKKTENSLKSKQEIQQDNINNAVDKAASKLSADESIEVILLMESFKISGYLH